MDEDFKKDEPELYQEVLDMLLEVSGSLSVNWAMLFIVILMLLWNLLHSEVYNFITHGQNGHWSIKVSPQSQFVKFLYDHTFRATIIQLSCSVWL